VLAYDFSENNTSDFSENRQFATKPDRNFIFFGRDPHILDRLYIAEQYMSFYAF
jgi:hypothetical protein